MNHIGHMQRHWVNNSVQSRFNQLRIAYEGGSQGEEADISEGIYMRKPSKVMIIRDLQEELWHIVEPRIDSQTVTTDSHERIMRLAIQRFVEEQAKSLSMAELADALDSLEQTAALFLEYLRSKGIAGDPIAVL
jgi:hypothetical protein